MTSSHGRGAGEGRSSRTANVILVDDEEPILASLRSLLRRSGYALETFSRAKDALDFVRRVPVDMIVSDLRMPTMTGIEFLNHAAVANPQAIRVILSGYEDRTVVMEALSKGLAHHYVMKPWDDAPLLALLAQSLERQEEMRQQRLQEVIGSIATLPSPPRYHMRLQAVLARADSSVDAITRELETSPPIVARLLRVANSVYFSARKTVTSVRDAVVFIGTDYIAGLVAAMEAFEGFAALRKGPAAEYLEDLWSMSCARAGIAKNIAERWPDPVEPHLTHVASLLQDIGYAVRLCSDPRRYEEYLGLVRNGQMSPHEVEISVFGITHDEVGAALLEYWNLPPGIVDGVRLHHRTTAPSSQVKILQLADIIQGAGRAMPHDRHLDGTVEEWIAKLQEDTEQPQAPEKEA